MNLPAAQPRIRAGGAGWRQMHITRGTRRGPMGCRSWPKCIIERILLNGISSCQAENG